MEIDLREAVGVETAVHPGGEECDLDRGEHNDDLSPLRPCVVIDRRQANGEG